MNEQIQKTDAAAVEFAKDLLMHDFAPLLQVLNDAAQLYESEKSIAFRQLVIALNAARAAAADVFRLARIESERSSIRSKMEKDLAEELKRVDALTLEEVAARRAS